MKAIRVQVSVPIAKFECSKTGECHSSNCDRVWDSKVTSSGRDDVGVGNVVIVCMDIRTFSDSYE